ncbi:MAG: putative metal-binding motif-containing protein [Deltaproteobacteria bacterium]|nr:putative metal-binding motif-containing protein [Deltaproteobacteria bacterium]
MLILSLLMPTAAAADFLQIDAAAPGMTVSVNLLREEGGLTGGEQLSSDCVGVSFGPSVALDRGADPEAPLAGAVISALLSVADDAPLGSCAVYVDGVELAPLTVALDNRLHVVAPVVGVYDGGPADADGAEDGVITVSSAVRSPAGVLVLDSLTVPDGVAMVFDATDPSPATPGNEAYLPAVVLVAGRVDLLGWIDVSGQAGGYANPAASEGGAGGPGGGGGAVGSNYAWSPAGPAGDGFTGGGGMVVDGTGAGMEAVPGGVGVVAGPDGEHGGEGVFTEVQNGALGYAGAAGGGTGSPWGTGGGGSLAYHPAGWGGLGGGGGAGHSDATYWGAGGGGFGTDGQNGVGTVGGDPLGSGTGGAGYANGHPTLVPLAGGSGGAGGECGAGSGDGAGGGGGGGTLALIAGELHLGPDSAVLAEGGRGGDTSGTNPGSSTAGAGGSGGGVLLAAPVITGLSDTWLSLAGGVGGRTAGASYYTSGSGGEGRLRVDGASPPALDPGPTGLLATTWEGPVITSASPTSASVRSGGPVRLIVSDRDGVVADLSVAEDGAADLTGLLPAGRFLLTVVDEATGVAGLRGAVIELVDRDGDGYLDTSYGGDDCDDTNPAVNPDAAERCDGVDNDCDGVTDRDAIDRTRWYMDLDGDGQGGGRFSALDCEAPEGYAASTGDCDDLDPHSFVGAPEVCDGADNDCDGLTDDADGDLDLSTASPWYTDGDADGYGAAVVVACALPAGASATPGDCDDAASAVYPGAPETCDGVDQDCDGQIDEDATDATTWYVDLDGDGHGGGRLTQVACEAPASFVATVDDCDDLDAFTFPGAPELCDAADNDCDGQVDEALSPLTWYTDADGDGFGDAGAVSESCALVLGAVLRAGDCDDGDASVNPLADEVWYDGADQDCDGGSDYDQDGDGADSPADCDDLDADVYPGAAEVYYDGVDGDCGGGSDYDADGDGEDALAFGGLDCDDGDPSVAPGAEEVWYDGVDQDCDGNDDDQDLDGYPADRDCDDTDPTAWPGAVGWTADCQAYVIEEDQQKGGCSTVPVAPAGALGWALGLLALARRRR